MPIVILLWQASTERISVQVQYKSCVYAGTVITKFNLKHAVKAQKVVEVSLYPFITSAVWGWSHLYLPFALPTGTAPLHRSIGGSKDRSGRI